MSEEKRHHIDIIEAQILRMSENSKQMKTWCVALTSGAIGIYLSTGNRILILIAFFVCLLFGLLDAYYLLLERRFRSVYNDVVDIPNKGRKGENLPKQIIPLYGMPIGNYQQEKKFYFFALKSPSVSLFYIAAMVLSALLIVIPMKKEDGALKVKLDDSTLSVDVAKPLNVITKGSDTIFIRNDTIKVKLEDTLYVKNFNKCVKYISSPCK